jgi:hypothetical protein
MKATHWTAAICVLGLLGAAFGERATTSFDQLEDGVVELQNALPGTRNPLERRASKVYVSVITKLSRDTGSLKAELKRGRQILPKLQKLEDPAVDALVVGAVDALADEIYGTLDEAQRVLDGLPADPAKRPSRQKVQTLLDVTRNHIERGVAAVKVKTTLAFLLRAEAKARRALRLAGKVAPHEPGGDGDECLGREIDAGEAISVTEGSAAPASFDAIGFATVQVEDRATTTVSLYDCTKDGTRVVNVTLPAPTPTGAYEQGAAAPEDAATFAIGTVGQTLAESTSGSAELTSVVDRLVMTFTFTADGVTTSGSVDVDPRP